ncbi:MAG: rhodanese-like domain-containing protein [Saprospiraceae bacterium]
MEDKSCKTPRWRLFKAMLNNLSPTAAQELIKKDPSLVIIDVRTPLEFAAGHLPNAINIDYFGDNFYDQIEGLDARKNYLIYCRSGRRSIRTCTLLINSGFPQERIYNLDGGWLILQDVLQLN